MQFIKDLKLGFKSYYDSILFINKHKMWYFFLFPVILFIGVYYLGFTFKSWEGKVIQDEEASIFYQVWLMFKKGLYAFLALIFLSFMRYVIILVISPLLSIISEKVERILTGNTYKFNLKQLIKDIKRALNLAIRNVMWEFGIAYGLLIALWIIMWLGSLDNWFFSLLEVLIPALVGFYYYGFGFIDYLNERLRLSIPESVIFVRKHKGFAIALGSVFTLIFVYTNDFIHAYQQTSSGTSVFILVLIGSVILSMIPIFTMVAATLGVHELVDLNKNRHAIKTQSKVVTEPLVKPVKSTEDENLE